MVLIPLSLFQIIVLLSTFLCGHVFWGILGIYLRMLHLCFDRFAKLFSAVVVSVQFLLNMCCCYYFVLFFFLTGY